MAPVTPGEREASSVAHSIASALHVLGSVLIPSITTREWGVLFKILISSLIDVVLTLYYEFLLDLVTFPHSGEWEGSKGNMVLAQTNLKLSVNFPVSASKC